MASNTAPNFAENKGDACVMFVSLSSRGSNGATYADPVIPDDIFIAMSAGNEGTTSSNGWIKAEKVYGVGAVNLKWSAMRNGEPMPGAELMIFSASYTSDSNHVDFGAPTDIYIDNRHDAFGGTSGAAPALAGIVALVQDLFIEKTGRPLSHQAMYQFLKDNSMDIEETGKDDRSGWGLPILPDPATVDVWKYQTLPSIEEIPAPEKEPVPEIESTPEEVPEINIVEPNPIPPEESTSDGTLHIDAYVFSYDKFVEYMNKYNNEHAMSLGEIFKEFARRLKTYFKSNN